VKLVVLGASAGGGSLIEQILSSLRQPLQGAVIIAMHIHEHYIDDFVDYLRSVTDIEVSKATDTTIKEGKIYVCDSSCNIVYRRFATTERLESQYVPQSLYRPSIDILFESLVAKKDMKNLCVALLSGIGRDGVKGMKRLFDTEALTLACNAQSAVVYGIPRVAIEEGVCKEVVDLTGLIARIKEFLE